MKVIRVFLADDHGVLREGLRALLAAHPGIEVVGEAADGPGTVDGAAALRPDVVVMDVANRRSSSVRAASTRPRSRSASACTRSVMSWMVPNMRTGRPVSSYTVRPREWATRTVPSSRRIRNRHS